MLKLSGAWLCGLYSVPQGSGLSRLRSSDNRPIAFFSRKLSKTQTRYTVIKIELLPIVETLKVFPNWDFERQERCKKVFTNTGTASDEEYDQMVGEKESMPGTRGIESEKNSGGNSSDNGSDWEENSLRKLVSAKLPTLSDKFSSNTDKIVVVSPVPSPRKATLRPPLNVAGVTLLRTPQGKLNKIIPVGT